MKQSDDILIWRHWWIILLVGLFSGQSLQAHNIPEASLFLDFQLTETELVFTAIGATHQFPPLEHMDPNEAPDDESVDKEKLVEFFASEAPVLIDGIVVAPVIKKLQFDFVEQGKEGIVPRYIMADMLLSYSIVTPPRQISMTWPFMPTFPEGVIIENLSPDHGSTEEVMTAFTIGDDYANSTFLTFTKEEPQFIWHADAQEAVVPLPERLKNMVPTELKPPSFDLPIVPVLCLVGLVLFVAFGRRFPALVRWAVSGGILAAAVLLPRTWSLNVPLPGEPQPPVITDAQVKEVFLALHANQYRAFDYEDEDAIYDALAESIDGPLLERVYNDVFQSLVLREEGGAVAKVNAVNILESEIIREEGQKFRFPLKWQVEGIVRHWGHLHRRTNEYEAVYGMKRVGADWKIDAVEVLSNQRLDGEE